MLVEHMGARVEDFFQHFFRLQDSERFKKCIEVLLSTCFGIIGHYATATMPVLHHSPSQLEKPSSEMIPLRQGNAGRRWSREDW